MTSVLCQDDHDDFAVCPHKWNVRHRCQGSVHKQTPPPRAGESQLSGVKRSQPPGDIDWSESQLAQKCTNCSQRPDGTKPGGANHDLWQKVLSVHNHQVT